MAEYQNPRLRVAMIARDINGRILLLQHVREHGNYWVLPGGGVDLGESVEDAMVREIREELGVESEVERLVAIGELIMPSRHVVDFFFNGKLEKDSGFKVKYEEGIGDARWFSVEEIEDLNILPPEIKVLFENPGESGSGEVRYLGRYESRK
ncbi:MAG: NUDIX hydrolase [bacterium]|nr:NUDIX hydrolase [bacterium]